MLELGGIRDVLTKSIGTQNPINLVKATMQGITSLRRPEQVAEARGLSVKQVLGLAEVGSTRGASRGSAEGGVKDASPQQAEAATAEAVDERG